MRRALVTGASGFIGCHLVRSLLETEWRVRGVSRDPSNQWPASPALEVVAADVRDPAAMKTATAECDTVFHLAARVHELDASDGDEEGYWTVNVEGTRNVLVAAVASGVKRFVFFSSVKAMGEGTRVCVDESWPAAPRTLYGRSKLDAERLVLETGRTAGMHVVCLRPPLVYGRGNRGNLFRMLAAIDAGRFPPLPDSGNRRSIVSVTNLVDAAVLAAMEPKANGQCYIVTDARAYSVRALYEAITRALGRRVPQWSVPLSVLWLFAQVGDGLGAIRGRRFVFDSDVLDKLIESSWYSSAKITHELGYRPRVSLDEALPDLVTWYRATRQ